ncbi:MAG: DUF5362 domain-containing protein [Rhodothermales bacterium]|nr:DUF5362 domain-containing protein [Rhodothermales bacterium]
MEYKGTTDGDMHAVITRMSKNMRFLGMSYVIIGGLNCLSIIGALIGIPMLISGLRLRESADSFGDWLDNEEGALLRALERQGRFFSIQAIILIVGLVLGVLMMVGVGVGMFAMVASQM